MRPLKIEFQAFGSYKKHEMVDLEAISSNGLFLICGNTGSGKSLILDAMTFALYGKSSGNLRNDFAAMRCTKADPETETYVRFIFEHGDDCYKFERRLEYKSKKYIPKCSVFCKTGQSEWQTLFENTKEKDVTDTAEKVIGLKYDQFRQVIILPQGQFERLLTSNSEEKEAILTSIFGIVKWKNIADKFYQKANERSEALKAINDSVNRSLEDENCRSVEELEERVNEKQKEHDRLTAEYVKADFDNLIRKENEKLVLCGRFGDLHNAEKNLNALEQEKEKYEKLEERMKEAVRAEKLREPLAELRNSEKELGKRISAEENAVKSAARAEVMAKEAAAALEEHKKKEGEVKELEARVIKYREKTAEYEGLKQKKDSVAAAERMCLQAVTEEKKARESYESYGGRINAAREEYEKLNNNHSELLRAYIAGITGILASELKEGEPCPVCGSKTHPEKAHFSDESITKKEVDAAKKLAEKKYEEMNRLTAEQENAKRFYEEKHAASEKAQNALSVNKTALEAAQKNLIPGINSLDELNAGTEKMAGQIRAYENKKEELEKARTAAEENFTKAKEQTAAAAKEKEEAVKRKAAALKALNESLSENGFSSAESAEAVMLSAEERNGLLKNIESYRANLRSAAENLESLRKELKDFSEPDEESIRKVIRDAGEESRRYNTLLAEISAEIKRLQPKLEKLKKQHEGLAERIKQAEEDSTFAKKLRGDTGTGLQRYVLGIMFSSVIASANEMLKNVYGGRYRLFRTDDKVQGSNKRGLDLKVFDRDSKEHEGRFVGSLSGGEKFLVSLALSIGMSAIAQNTGIRIQALFIDEGFGTLDEKSVDDAMEILQNVQKSNGMVGIISHMQIMLDQIPNKLEVRYDKDGSRIVKSIG